MAQKILAQINLEGAEVKFTHARFYDGLPGPVTRNMADKLGLRSPNPRGGVTLCRIVLPDGTTVSQAAVCSSHENFCKATGRQVALGRAKKRLARGKF